MIGSMFLFMVLGLILIGASKFDLKYFPPYPASGYLIIKENGFGLINLLGLNTCLTANYSPLAVIDGLKASSIQALQAGIVFAVIFTPSLLIASAIRIVYSIIIENNQSNNKANNQANNVENNQSNNQANNVENNQSNNQTNNKE